MNLFKSFTLKWWQGAIYKIGMGLLGIAVGAHFHTLFAPHVGILLVTAAIALSYITLIWFQQ